MKKKLLSILLSLFMMLTVFPSVALADGEFTVTYDANEATSGTVPVDSKNYSVGDEVTVLGKNDLKKDGFVFGGWNTKTDGSGDNYQNGHTFNITGNTTLYVNWVEPKVRIQITNKDSATGTVEYKFDTEQDFTTYSGNAPVTIPNGATTIIFKATPDSGFAVQDCTILYDDEDIDEEKGYMVDVIGDGYEYTLPNDSDTVFKVEFVEEILYWHTISWGGGNVVQENGQVIPDVIHVGESSYSAPFTELTGEDALKEKGVTYSDGDLFVLDGIGDDVSIDFHFIPNYGYQVTDVIATEDSLLDSFTTGDEISTFTFAYEPETNVHFEVEFTSKEDIIDLNSELINNANITNGENAIESGNLKLEIEDIESDSASVGLIDVVDGEDAQYVQMELSQVVDKAVSDDVWDKDIIEFDDPIEVTIDVNDLDPTCDYYIVREHIDGDGNASYDQIDVNRDGNNITFETNKFSTYALVKKPLEEKEFKVEYDERRDDEGNINASIEVNGKTVSSLETIDFITGEPIEFTLNAPDDRKANIPFVEIEVFDGDDSQGIPNTMWGSFYSEKENRIELDGDSFTFTPEKDNPFIVRVIWSEYDWFGPEPGQYMVETNIIGGGLIVSSIDSVNGISHGNNQRKDCYAIGKDNTLTFVFDDSNELDFVAFGFDLFTKDAEEGTRPLSDLWNESKGCYQIVIEDASEFDQYYIEAHFTGDVYKVTEGKNIVININEGKDVLFVSNAEFDKFVGILVDGEEVDPSNYTVSEGSTRVLVKSSYLKTLTTGEHILEIVSEDGSASCEFTITNKSKTSPKTPYIIPNTGVN